MPPTLFSLGEEVLETYKQVKGGIIKMPYPWDTLNRWTMGLWPGKVTGFVSRPGVGKTFVVIIVGRHLWQQGFRVLLISPEMASVDIAERFFVIDSDVSYLSTVHGTLTNFDLDKLEKSVKEQKNQSGIWVVDTKHGIRPDMIESYIRMLKPDAVGIDTIGRLPFKGDEREVLSQASKWSCYLAATYGVPVFIAHHLGKSAERSVKKGGGSTLGNISWSDDIAKDFDYLFALEQDSDMKQVRRMRIRDLKIRRGIADAPAFHLDWDFDKMKFQEVGSAPVNAPSNFARRGF